MSSSAGGVFLPLDPPPSTGQVLTTPTIASPTFSGTVTGTYTLAGTQTLSSPTLTTPSISGATITGVVTVASGATLTTPAVSGATITGVVTVASGATITTPTVTFTSSELIATGATGSAAAAAPSVYPAFVHCNSTGVSGAGVNLPTGACVPGAFYVIFNDQTGSKLARIDLDTGHLDLIRLLYTSLTGIQVSGSKAAMFASSSLLAERVLVLDLDTKAEEIVRVANPAHIDSGHLSASKHIEFPTEGGKTAHATYYPPRNRDFQAPEGEKPPLVVHCHGGPTGAGGPTYAFEFQYWTSRGFALVDVSYGGSTGYGRAYRQRLDGMWGVVDVDDCINAAKYLVEQGLVDPKRISITGGSAGGYTVLLSLTKRDFYAAGASHYGIGDLELFVKETHKFESRYCDRLLGPYPERADVYRDRSAIRFADRMSAPVILFQGLDDKIVPPDQAETFVAACKEKNLPYAYVPFEGEQHGFRQDKNIRRAMEGELYFLSQIFGIELADKIEPVEIENFGPGVGERI